MGFYLFCFIPIDFCSFSGHYWEGSSSIFFIPSHWLFTQVIRLFCSLFSRLNGSSSQLLHIGQMLDLCGVSRILLQNVPVFLVLGSPEVNQALQVFVASSEWRRRITSLDVLFPSVAHWAKVVGPRTHHWLLSNFLSSWTPGGSLPSCFPFGHLPLKGLDWMVFSPFHCTLAQPVFHLPVWGSCRRHCQKT